MSKLKNRKVKKVDKYDNWSISIRMPELNCSFIIVHIPTFGLRKGSLVPSLFLPNPHATNTWTMDKNGIHNLDA